MFSDLHAHPALYGFNRLRNGPFDGDARYFHPWFVPDDVNHEHMARGLRASTYTQATMPMLADAGVRLMFGSITPIEKGFFVGSEEGDESNFAVEMLKLATGRTFVSTATKFIVGDSYAAGMTVTRVLRNRGPARKALQRAYMKYSAPRVDYMQSPRLDYWDEFQRELQYYRNADGLRAQGRLTRPDGSHATIEGQYDLVRSRAHLDEILASRDGIAVFLTIEGAHTFSIGPDGRRVDDDTLFGRIEELRTGPEQFSFVTLAHHFSNELCGHAHSLPDAASWVMDQSRGLGAEINPTGRRAILELLDLDDTLQPRGGRRILIDCKHLSARSRRTYYREVVEPHNAWARAAGAPPIPVVLSHSAYSGVATLDELIDNESRETDLWLSPPFLKWSINHCDEDVRAVVDSGGLIGFVFDQRVNGLPSRQQLPTSSWIELFVRQLFGTADAVLQDERLPQAQRLAVWDCLCLGTDFDGLIQPFAPYPTALHLRDFAEDLTEQLHRYRHTRGIEQIGVKQLADKILWKNAVDFARRTAQ